MFSANKGSTVEKQKQLKRCLWWVIFATARMKKKVDNRKVNRGLRWYSPAQWLEYIRTNTTTMLLAACVLYLIVSYQNVQSQTNCDIVILRQCLWCKEIGKMVSVAFIFCSILSLCVYFFLCMYCMHYLSSNFFCVCELPWNTRNNNVSHFKPVIRSINVCCEFWKIIQPYKRSCMKINRMIR